MKIIRFEIYNSSVGPMAHVWVPAEHWLVRLWRIFFPLKGIEVPADGFVREFNLTTS